jgi:hypothetical protein
VTLAEFLSEILKSHGQTLLRLAALLGEETLLELLEQAEELDPIVPTDPVQRSIQREHEVVWQEKTRAKLVFSAEKPPQEGFAQIHSSVQDMNLPSVLEFYVWAYPYYRAFIESELDLKLRIPPHQPSSSGATDSALSLVEEAVHHAKDWFRRLPIPPGVAGAAERAAELPWFRFRTEILKRLGHRPLSSV